jgi:hypothetical protein
MGKMGESYVTYIPYRGRIYNQIVNDALHNVGRISGAAQKWKIYRDRYSPEERREHYARVSAANKRMGFKPWVGRAKFARTQFIRDAMLKTGDYGRQRQVKITLPKIGK